MMFDRPGHTLLELLVVLVILGVMGTIAGAAFVPEPPPSPAQVRHDVLNHAKQQALVTRRPVSVILPSDSSATSGTAYPDGRILLESGAGIDPMTGVRYEE